MPPQWFKMSLVDFQIMMPLMRDAAVVALEKFFQFAAWPHPPPRITRANAPSVGLTARARLAAHAIDDHLDFSAKPGTHPPVPAVTQYLISPRVKRTWRRHRENVRFWPVADNPAGWPVKPSLARPGRAIRPEHATSGTTASANICCRTRRHGTEVRNFPAGATP